MTSWLPALVPVELFTLLIILTKVIHNLIGMNAELALLAIQI